MSNGKSLGLYTHYVVRLACLAVPGVAPLTFSEHATAQTGPDAVTGNIVDIVQLGRVGSIGSGVVGLGIGTTVCNKGDTPISLNRLPEIEHPVIVANAYRLATVNGSDRLEQIGQAWIKHTGSSLNIDECGFGCSDPLGRDDQVLPGCSDTYLAIQFEPCGLGGTGSAMMGQRSAIHPYTGAICPGGLDFGPGGGCNVNFPSTNHIGHLHDGISHRLQVQDIDLMPELNASATYFAEGQYVTPDEFLFANGNQNNNVAHKEFTVAGPDKDGVFTFDLIGGAFSESPAIDAWHDSQQSLIEPAPMADGRAFLAYKVTMLDGGLWHYEYAIYNMNMYRSIQSFSVRVPSDVTISAIEFHAPLNHAPETNAENYSNDPWDVSTAGGAVSWSTDPFALDPMANAIRYATMYNFRFDADTPPQSVYAGVGFFKITGIADVATLGPQAIGPQDCNNNLIEDACDLDCTATGCEVPGCGASTDCDGTGVPDECERDCNDNGVADACDIEGETSSDCTGNGIPDECEDDCDLSGTADVCELAAGTSQDCNADGVPDQCNVARGLTSAVDLCPCVQSSRVSSPIQENRFLTIVESNPDRAELMRVIFANLQPPYDIWNGTTLYVGEPHRVCENSGQGRGVAIADCGPAPGLPDGRKWSWFAPLVCAEESAHRMDWHGVCSDGSCVSGLKVGEACANDSECAGAVNLYHEGIIPSKLQTGGGEIAVPSVYAVQTLDASCSDVADECSYSPALGVTQPAWGDIVRNCTTCPCGPPNLRIDLITDVVAVISKFQNLSCAPRKARTDLRPRQLDFKVDFVDIVETLTAFQGGSYPFAPSTPSPCF